MVLLLLIYLAYIALGLPDSLLGGAWALMRVELGADVELAGVLTLITSLLTVLSSLCTSRLIRRFGTGRVTLVSVLLTGIGLAGYALATSAAMLIPIAIVLGAGAGSVDAALSNFAAHHYETRHMNWLHACWGVGAMGGTYVMAGFLSRGQWRWGYGTVALVLMAIVVCLASTLKLWRAYERRDDGQDAQQRHVTNRQALAMRGVKRYMLAMFSCNSVECIAGLWMATFFIQARGMDVDVAAACCSLFYIGMTGGRIVAGAFAARTTDAALIRVGSVVAMTGSALMLLPMPGYATAAALLLTGLGSAPIYSCIVHVTPSRFDESVSATVVGLELSAAYAGSMCMPAVAGFMSARLGMWVIPALLLIGYAAVPVCMRKHGDEPAAGSADAKKHLS